MTKTNLGRTRLLPLALALLSLACSSDPDKGGGCGKGSETPLDCKKGTHEEDGACVKNPPTTSNSSTGSGSPYSPPNQANALPEPPSGGPPVNPLQSTK